MATQRVAGLEEEDWNEEEGVEAKANPVKTWVWAAMSDQTQAKMLQKGIDKLCWVEIDSR